MKNTDEKLEIMRKVINKLGKRITDIENHLDINEPEINTEPKNSSIDDESLDALKKIIGL